MNPIRELEQDYKKWIGLHTGVLYLDPGTGEIDMGNVNSVAMVPEREIHPIIEGESNQEIDTIEFIPARIFKCVLDKFGDYQIWERMIGIIASDMTATTVPITDESILLGLAPTWTSLKRGQGNESPISAVAITGEEGAPEYTENVQYIVDYIQGRICPIASGGIEETVVEVDYSYTTQASKRIKFPDSVVNTIVALRFAHKLMNGKIFTVKMPRARIAEIAEVPLTPETPSGIALTFRSLRDYTQAEEEHGYTDLTQ